MSHPDPIQELIDLRLPAVAVSFREEAPAGVERIPAAAAAGCGYWSLAAEGRVFYTEAVDHHGCPVGAHTHGIDLPPEKAEELQGLVQVMVGLEYLRLEEVPTLPRRGEQFGVAIYAPLAEAPVEPDVVLVRGNARQIMLLTEAAQAAGVHPDSAAMGRPACAVVPQTLQGERGSTSLGCIGNRVYTGLKDDELYFAIPGPSVQPVIEKLATIAHANRALEEFHRARMPAAEAVPTI